MVATIQLDRLSQNGSDTDESILVSLVLACSEFCQRERRWDAGCLECIAVFVVQLQAFICSVGDKMHMYSLSVLLG